MEELKIGSIHSYSHVFTQADFDDFAALSGDDNPIHVDPDFAAQTRFGRTVAHGMLLYSTLCGYLGTQFPGPGTIQKYQKMTFYSPTFVGEQVKFEIQVNQSFSDSDLVELNTKVIRPNQEVGLQGKTLVGKANKSQVQGSYSRSMLECSDQQVDASKGLQLGQSAHLERLFTQSNLETYSNISGDSNPIYTSIEYAKEVGLKNHPLPGGLLGSMFSCLLGTKLPGRGTNWLKQSLYYPAPAYLGEKIRAKVEIIRLRPEKDLVNLHTICTNPRGEVICDGEALVYVKDLEQQNKS
jgi:acyl dehydratase